MIQYHLFELKIHAHRVTIHILQEHTQRNKIHLKMVVGENESVVGDTEDK